MVLIAIAISWIWLTSALYVLSTKSREGLYSFVSKPNKHQCGNGNAIARYKMKNSDGTNDLEVQF